MKKLTIDTTLPKNLPLLLKSRVDENPKAFLQAAKDKDGVYQKYTYSFVYDQIILTASALKFLGVKKGNKVAIISDNRREWLITDMAVQFLGAADVPRGCDSLGPEIRFIIDYSDSEVAFFENLNQLEKVTEKINEVPKLKIVITFENLDVEKKKELASLGLEAYDFTQLVNLGQVLTLNHFDEVKSEIEKGLENIEQDDIATIIFTSGTTGTPKGAMLSHNNYISQLSAVHNFMPGKPGEWWMSILPVWHSFERLAQYVTILLKCGLAYSKPNARVLLADMASIQPRWMCGVPRLWEALTTGVNRTMQKTGGITFKLYKFFMAVGRDYADCRDLVIGNIMRETRKNKILGFFKGIIPFLFLWPLHMLGDLLVYRKIRSKFGGRFVFAVSGGGALQKETNEFFRAISLTMLEGYGLTETAPSVAFRNWRFPQKEGVGTVFPTIQLKIVPEQDGQIAGNQQMAPGKRGLILIKGPHVMKGYYKRPDLTAKIIDDEGWLNTGDVGFLSYDKELKITGRAKDTIVLLDGENIEPVGIENALCASEFIESAIVFGQDKKYLASLIVPSKVAIEAYALKNKIKCVSYEELLKHPQIKGMMDKLVNDLISLKKGFRSCEKVFKIALLSESFKVGQELSVKLEMKRFKIAEMYASIIATLF